MRHLIPPAGFALLVLAACSKPAPVETAAPVPAAAAPTSALEPALAGEMTAMLAAHRKIIVLLDGVDGLAEAERAAAETAGRILFHDKLMHQQKLEELFDGIVSGDAAKRAQVPAALDYMESDPKLFDADRLAFREALQALQESVGRDGSLPAVKLHKRIGEDLDALEEIERNYSREIAQIFNRFEQRAIAPKREKWDDYVTRLKTLYARDALLKEYATSDAWATPETPEEAPAPPTGMRGAAPPAQKEIFGDRLPKKTIALTFDDGPHPKFTAEIVAILQQYGAPATFFQVGQNLGTLDAKGAAKLSANAAVSRKLIAQGYTVGNHSFSHAQLSKTSGDKLRAEIGNTDLLLQAVDSKRSPLFRFPYGARNAEGMERLADAHLRSIMWNIDSMDWADPVPSSIADRVLRAVDKQGRGIILFHDIHQRTVKALPLVLDRLVADGYSFASWDGSDYTTRAVTVADGKQPAAVTTAYATSWAVVIGINDYQKWPKLQYAVNDADALRDTLVQRFGFPAEQVITLKNAEATRNGILNTFHDKLAKLQKNDRVMVFYAGHGATRKLSSGRDVGYIIPADADPDETATDGIPMTEIQNIAESLVAKHVLFVMDACYSGLGLARGASSGFLRDNATRIGRQMLTAGGADQMVADGGPGGHSVFTWTVLQGLGGKSDLNGDGLITATELAAYVAPAVSGVSLQTPAFGSLPGSEGGDFVFEIPAQSEYLSASSAQLSSDAIALNQKLDAASPAPAAPGETRAEPVKVLDLQGKEQVIAPAPAVPVSPKQLAQNANDRGLQLYKEKKYAEAEAAFTEALKLKPDFALAANNLGFLYYKQERYADAARWFEATIKLDRSRAIAYLNLGDAYARSKRAQPAKQAYQTYLELAPNGGSAAYAKEQLAKL